jgi:large subunit ribosomal protein L18
LKHIYAQIIDDEAGLTLVSASTLDDDVRSEVAGQGKIEQAKVVGKRLAEKALSKGVEKVVFDRGGYAYHGRVKALADASREGGLVF